MAVQSVPAPDQFATSLNRRERNFAELIRQVRAVQANENRAANVAEAEEEALTIQDREETRRNRDFIARLHDDVDTLRGEILARAIVRQEEDSADAVGKDISRLNARLETLRTKLNAAEERLSGHLLDIKV